MLFGSSAAEGRDLAILDIGAPHDRIGTAGHHPAYPEIYDLPMLMLTARREKIDAHIARVAGANDYLRKPFDPDDLIAKVNQLLRRAGTRRPDPPLRAL